MKKDDKSEGSEELASGPKELASAPTLLATQSVVQIRGMPLVRFDSANKESRCTITETKLGYMLTIGSRNPGVATLKVFVPYSNVAYCVYS